MNAKVLFTILIILIKKIYSLYHFLFYPKTKRSAYLLLHSPRYSINYSHKNINKFSKYPSKLTALNNHNLYTDFF